MRALVTGCAGFIGSHLTESLLADGWSIVGVDCFNENYGRGQKLRNLERSMELPGFEFVPIDLSRGDLQDLVDDSDVVFHLAAEPGVRSSWGTRFEAYLRNNVAATQHLLEAARRSPEKRFVYASSSSIYGEPERLPTPESLVPKPFSPYGVTKLAGEHLCQLYHGNYGVQCVSLRYFSVYGPRQRPDMAFTSAFRKALRAEPISVFGDGNQTRDFTYVGDIVAATRLAAEAPNVAGEVFNIGGGSRVSLREALTLLDSLLDVPLRVEYTSAERGDVRHTSADTSRARALLGFEPTMAFEQGLAKQAEWARSVFSEPQETSGTSLRPVRSVP
jgi:nucleoside-diphosphate-sugar epimerase